uniref:Uncharacterized protein n=1 Tax=Trichuris muris TaxID=70415 RepID=A0A5S6QGW1_TRIMR
MAHPCGEVPWLATPARRIESRSAGHSRTTNRIAEVESRTAGIAAPSANRIARPAGIGARRPIETRGTESGRDRKDVYPLLHQYPQTCIPSNLHIPFVTIRLPTLFCRNEFWAGEVANNQESTRESSTLNAARVPWGLLQHDISHKPSADELSDFAASKCSL